MSRFHVTLTILMAAILLPACSGGSVLSGDGDEDNGVDQPPELQDVHEAVDLAMDPDDPDVRTCIDTYSRCGCEPGCVDGFTDFVWYPSDAGGPFPEAISPPAELLEIGVARYQCSVCSCEESWSIKYGEEWREVGVEEMCTHIVSYDGSCDGCLEIWVGGCC